MKLNVTCRIHARTYTCTLHVFGYMFVLTYEFHHQFTTSIGVFTSSRLAVGKYTNKIDSNTSKNECLEHRSCIARIKSFKPALKQSQFLMINTSKKIPLSGVLRCGQKFMAGSCSETFLTYLMLPLWVRSHVRQW